MQKGDKHILDSFIAHFSRAVNQKIDVMRERMRAFEIQLDEGQRVEGNITSYQFRLVTSDTRLVPGMECTLRCNGCERLIRILSFDDDRVTILSRQEISLSAGHAALVCNPWYLYEKLLSLLPEIGEGAYFVDRAMTLFGKLPPNSSPGTLVRNHDALNDSQRAAIQLCLDTDLAFVWGPPGTGKTTTLAHIIDELIGNGFRLLVVSTTNSAVDQVLTKIVHAPSMAGYIEQGKVIRLGRTSVSTFGTSLRDVASRIHSEAKVHIDQYRIRRKAVDTLLAACAKLLEALETADAPVQHMLFCYASGSSESPDLSVIFTPGRVSQLERVSPRQLADLVQRRAQRLEKIRRLLDTRIAERRDVFQKREAACIDHAELILTTLTNAYFSPHLHGQRFDVVIVEEASMAILPALFYAACLGERKTVIVGDPCQLPPVVQSDDPYVHRVLGRNIFKGDLAWQIW